MSQDKIQNFSSISLKLCLLGQKYTGTRFVNNNIGFIVFTAFCSRNLKKAVLPHHIKNVPEKNIIDFLALSTFG